jgi:hypothetical protein
MGLSRGLILTIPDQIHPVQLTPSDSQILGRFFSALQRKCCGGNANLATNGGELEKSGGMITIW